MYFPNGTSLMIFQERVCCGCVWEGATDEDGTRCSVIFAHFMSQTLHEDNDPLHNIIPNTPDDLKCLMFYRREDDNKEHWSSPTKLPLKGCIAKLKGQGDETD